jgi:hypothetical protein
MMSAKKLVITTKDTDDDTFWNSPEARHLFEYMNPVNYKEEEQAVVTLKGEK